MDSEDQKVDELLKARAALDEELRRYKATVTVMFTDVVGSTSYFERYGDTAGLAMLGRHAQAVTEGVMNHRGRVIKNIGDSVMAEFPDPLSAAEAGVEIQRHLLQLNASLPERERIQVRIGINSGPGFRRGNDLFGDVVNVAARITKHCSPAQILVSHSIFQALNRQSPLRFKSLGSQAFHGKEEKEEIFEMLWTDTQTYTALRQKVDEAVAQGYLTYSSKPLDTMVGAASPQTPPPVSVSAPGPTTPLPASLASRYAILGEAGRGGMGVVYKAHDLETGEVVALKVLKPEIASNPAVLERFKNEVRLARKITHRNVCRTYEFGRADAVAYISMEYVDGESLRAVLNRFGGLPPAKTFAVAREICAGLAEAHQQGVIHRDLKPENVMLDRNGHVKLMDFGIARSLEISSGTTGSIIGTPEYMAPEQAQGQAVDARTDVYALGLILYECLTGSPAFSGETPIAVALKQVREPPPRPSATTPTIPPATEQMILRCLEKDPARRFQSVAELDAALGQAMPAKTTAVPPGAVAAAAVQSATFPQPRSRIKVWLVAGVIPLVIQGGFLWAVWQAARLAHARLASPPVSSAMPLSIPTPSNAIPAPAALKVMTQKPTQNPLKAVTKPAAAPSAARSGQTAATQPAVATTNVSPVASPQPELRVSHSAVATAPSAQQNFIPNFQAPMAPPANARPQVIYLVAGRYSRPFGANLAMQRLWRLGVASVRIQPLRQPLKYMVFVGPFGDFQQAQGTAARLRKLGMAQVGIIRQNTGFGMPPSLLVSAGQYPGPYLARSAAQRLWRSGVRNIHIRPLGSRVTGYAVLVGPFHNPGQANAMQARLRNEGFPDIARFGKH